MILAENIHKRMKNIKHDHDNYLDKYCFLIWIPLKDTGLNKNKNNIEFITCETKCMTTIAFLPWRREMEVYYAWSGVIFFEIRLWLIKYINPKIITKRTPQKQQKVKIIASKN